MTPLRNTRLTRGHRPRPRPRRHQVAFATVAAVVTLARAFARRTVGAALGALAAA